MVLLLLLLEQCMVYSLHHLQFFGNQLTNEGLKEIFDHCSHLEALDLRYCFNLKVIWEEDVLNKLKNCGFLTILYIADSELRFNVRGYGSPCKFNPMSLLGFPDNEDYDEYRYGIYNGCCSEDSDWYDDLTKPSWT